ncbi:MAG: 4-alpha-glucanotransferase [Acidimicrobiales bacterium]
MADGGRWGVQPGYHDFRGVWRDAPDDTVRAALGAMGAGRQPEPAPAGTVDPDSPVHVVTQGERLGLAGRWSLLTEDGAQLVVDGGLPADLPPGYHRLRREEDGHLARLVVSPGTCVLPGDRRTWGWAVQLYAARSRSSWGMGDLADLARLGQWSAGQGAGMALVNPLHAALPVGPQQASPYSPSSRCFRSPLYLRVEDVPEAASLGPELAPLAAAGRALNERRHIDRDEVWRLKSEALWKAWARFQGDPGFDRYLEQEGPALAGFATFCVLAEEHGVPWSEWPPGLRHPDSPDVVAFVARAYGRVRFHQWLQWHLDRQLARAGEAVGVVQDLAIGVGPAGADAWYWQECFALDMRVGAPPDEFAAEGQDWGLPPFDPWQLRAAAYEPFIATLRAALRHAGGVRIDHVMGLFRLFWVPAGSSPAEGVYVSYPWKDLLGILALESHRAGAWVVGEDLGTVEPFVREELARRRVLSYRLLWFEPEPPRCWPAQSLAAVTTHDLPTVAGLWTGADEAEQVEIGVDPNAESTAGIRARLRRWTGLDQGAPVDKVVRRSYELMAEAPSPVVAATLDDALLVEERPNVPGTTSQRPNWCLALPRSLEDIEADPVVADVAATLARRPPPTTPE